MKLKYKILFIIILFFTLFLFNTDTVKAVDVTIHEFEEHEYGQNYLAAIKNTSEYKSGDYYVLSYSTNGTFSGGVLYFINKNIDFKTYLIYDWSSFYRFTFPESIEVIKYRLNIYQSSNNYMDSYENKSINRTESFNITEPFYLYSDIDIYTDNTFSDYFYTINDFELSSIKFTESTSLNPLTLETNFFKYENISNYRLYVSYENTSNFVESGNIATYTDVQSNKTYFYFTYLPDKNGVYYFRLYNRSTEEWSNTYTFTFEGVDIGSNVSSNIEIPNFYIEKGDNSFILQTQWLHIDKRDDFHLFYSKENNIFYDCEGDNLSTLTYTDTDGSTYFRYKLIIYEEGKYNFKFINIEENTSSLYTSVNLSFDIDYSYTMILQPGFDFVPELEYTLSFEDFDKVIIYSQWFDTKYKDVYRLYLHNNISDFEDTYSEIEEKDGLWRFKYTATENREYHFRIHYITDVLSFYSIGSQSYLDFVFERLFNLYENSFGFLTYPFTFFFDLCNRFLNIEFKEPVIDIPDIYVPLYEDSPPLISATQINFNEIIESNSIFKIIHNLILICTDAFIVFGLINLFKKKWNEVFRH